ncbi:cAMP-regulated phosphoprotein 21 isoform X2 [Agrilus planipennis]|uniref:cAMP-regulated phosphoprotein 21 isoform X2 n=1 Tax=Agrilus planipennis TaxID=224129 RepID=A0A7F5R394_AGRPL|nr:cAMP-regulated phosphoprotein 21 isoform X2 [Agrilus planipennis]
MDPDPDEGNSPQQTRRNNSKLKVLVRSHAMREETSPPRDPVHARLVSPSIKVISSPATTPSQSPPLPQTKALVVLSPPLHIGKVSSCTSSSSTLVSSPMGNNSPSEIVYAVETVLNKYSEGEIKDGNEYSLVKENQDKLQESLIVQEEISHENIFVNETSQDRCRHETCICNCPNQKCLKCFEVEKRNSNINNNVMSNPNTLTVTKATKIGKFRQQSSSSQGSFDAISSCSSRLSRESSSNQYTDTTGIDLDQFIAETLNRNAKDRAFMLRIEQELVNFAKDRLQTHFKFPQMSSYHRMLVHRCAAYFGMDHNIESSGKCVVVNKTKNTRIPEVEFKDHIREDIVFSEEPRRSILKRDSNSMDDYGFKSPDRQFGLESRRSKSFEEREEEYEKVRRRIFSKEMQEFSSAEEFYWADIPWSSSDSDYSSRCKLIPPGKIPGRLLKSVETESETSRPCVAKSYSFGGYAGMSTLTRGDSVVSTHSAGPRLLTKQDSGASTVSWRLSPSSSGYKSQSQLSESVTPSPTSTPYPADTIRSDACGAMSHTNINESSSLNQSEGQVVWAVTDIQHVPKGSIIIIPQTGEPLKNKDGSIYHYDPMNPPAGINTVSCKPPVSPQKSPTHKIYKEISSPKRRSRSSPLKKFNTTNSSTSPSLPFTPPPQHCGNAAFRVPNEAGSLPFQQFPILAGGYGSVTGSETSICQQPCVIYGSYGTPLPQNFENRIESHVQEPSLGYYVQLNLPEVPPNQSPQLAYQQQSLWPQLPLTCYQNSTSSNVLGQRLAMSLPSGQAGPCLSSSFPQNYVPQHIANLPQQPSHNTEFVPIFPQQHIHMVYPQQTNQPSPIIYPNQPIVYAQNPLYHNVMVPVQNIPYPQCTSASSIPASSNTIFNPSPPDQGGGANIGQITHGMNQLNVFPGQAGTGGSSAPLQMGQYDIRTQKNGTPKGNKFSIPKNFSTCSSHGGSTGTNSPATTVIAGGYSGGQGQSLYQTPQTSPTQNVQFSYASGFVQAGLHKQAPNVFPTTSSRSSRSPTPAGDIPHNDKQRFSLPPTLYQGVPFVLQDPRIMSNRVQTPNYRQPPRQQSFNQVSENCHRFQKSRKFRGNKNIPTNGK